MKINAYHLLILGCLTVLWASCNKSDTSGSYTHEGIHYDRITKLNAESTSMYDPRDHKVYAVSRIGTQVWMAENLRYETEGVEENPNNPIPKYGCLYNWSAATVACPEGWHLPSDSDWRHLEQTMGMAEHDLSKIGWRDLLKVTELKSQSGWAINNNGSNVSGFNIFPAGRYVSGSFKNLGDYAFFGALP